MVFGPRFPYEHGPFEAHGYPHRPARFPAAIPTTPWFKAGEVANLHPRQFPLLIDMLCICIDIFMHTWNDIYICIYIYIDVHIIYIYVTYVYITFHFILFLIVKTPSVCFIRWFPSSQQLGDEALWGELRQPAGKVPAHRDVLQLLRAVFQWIGRENLQESPILKLSNGKVDGFRLRFSLKPIYWVLSWWFWELTGQKRLKNQQEYRNIIWKICMVYRLYREKWSLNQFWMAYMDLWQTKWWIQNVE